MIPWVDWSSPLEASFRLAMIEVLDESGDSIWLDIPSRMAPMGRIPREVQGGRAIRLSHTGGEWFTMPEGDPLEEAQALTGTISLAGDPPRATLDGGLEIRALAGVGLKEQVKNMPPFMRSTMVEQFVQRALPGSKVVTGKLEHFADRDAPLRISFEVESPTLIQVRDGVPSISSIILPNGLQNLLRTSERQYPFYSPTYSTSWESIDIELGDYLPTDLPPDVNFDGPWGKFVAKSRVENGVLHLERLLDLRPFLLSAERWEEFSEFCRQVDRREEMRISLEIGTP